MSNWTNLHPKVFASGVVLLVLAAGMDYLAGHGVTLSPTTTGLIVWLTSYLKSAPGATA